jgi:predicted protein tyrosine phosphatase
MTIYVCSLSRVESMVAQTGASHVVSLVTEKAVLPPLPRIAVANRLRLNFNDITAPTEGLVMPTADHVSQLIAFVQTWQPVSPLLIHCWAGVSRSTAAAFITACVHHPERGERDIAQALRAASPIATPNPRLVAYADEQLGRGGRMVAAIDEIGRGMEMMEGIPFCLKLDTIE